MRNEFEDLVGLEEVRLMGLDPGSPPKEACPHCGKTYRPLAMVALGKIHWITHEPCGCNGEKIEIKRDMDRQEARKRALAREKLARCGIPKRFLDAELDKPELLKYLAEFESSHGTGIYLHGEVGRGKSHLASALAREFVQAGYSTVFTTAADMLGSIQDTFGTSSSTFATTGKFAHVDILVIDDLGKESASQWSVGVIFQVLNARYEQMKPTVITSQYTLEGLRSRMSRSGERETAEAIVSRLRRTQKIIELTGPDRRAVVV